MLTVSRQFLRGDKFVQPFTVRSAGFNFAATTARAQIRKEPDAALIDSATVTLDASTLGTLEGEIIIPAAISTVLPQRCMTELEIVDEDAGMGPITPFRVALSVQPDVTV
jgi:hypothetical protein